MKKLLGYLINIILFGTYYAITYNFVLPNIGLSITIALLLIHTFNNHNKIQMHQDFFKNTLVDIFKTNDANINKHEIEIINLTQRIKELEYKSEKLERSINSDFS